MREYDDRDAAERDPELDLQIIWRCNVCGHERMDRPGWNEGGACPYCAEGVYQQAGESYTA